MKKTLSILCLLFFFFLTSSFSQEYALVLSGGGGKGAYQVGVWKALTEYGLAQKVSVISGTSVGALNAALFAAVSPSEAEKIWLEEVPEKLSQNQSLISQKGLESLLDSVPLEKISGSPMKVYVCAVRDRLKLLKFIDSKIFRAGVGSHSYYFNINDDSRLNMKSKLLASSAFPLLCDSVFVKDGDGGHYYSDGGEESVGGNNIPIEPVLEHFKEISKIIVVYLSDRKHVSRRLKVKDYDSVDIIELFPSIDIDGDGLLEGILDGTTNFSETRIRLLIKKGYDDTASFLRSQKIYPVSSYWFE